MSANTVAPLDRVVVANPGAEGHLFRILVACRGADAEFGPGFSVINHWVEVHAESLAEALQIAAGTPKEVWFGEAAR